MKQFLTELSQLMDKHSITMRAVEEMGAWNTFVDGIEFYMEGKYSKDGETVRNYCEILAPVELNSQDVKNLIK